MADLFTIHSSALPRSARVVGFHGTEGLSRIYRFEVLIAVTGDAAHEVDLQGAVGATATLRLDLPSGAAEVVAHGVLATVELVNAVADRAVLRAVLVPRLWHLTRSLHSRVFTGESVPSIIASILEQGGLHGAYRLELTAKYAPQEHVCQYRESDFDFISRWMEREGLYYFFEQESGAERLVITDDREAHEPLGEGPARYFPQERGSSSAGTLRTFTCRASSLPAAVRLKDYDYARPTLEVAGRAAVSSNGVGEINLHGARFWSPEEGERLARVKAESLLAEEVVYRGTGAVYGLRAGYTFDVEDHPRASFNARYLTTDLEHWANQAAGLPELGEWLPSDDPYRVEITAIAAGVQYRAPQKTPWPRIYGTEHAVIDGPDRTQYAQIDAQGRYAVKFHFDESDLGEGKASTRIRMMQPHGGGVEGFHFPLRAGTEVVCTFTGGDPDRPVIAGVVSNALTPSPITEGNHTQNIIRTGGRNRIVFEDDKDHERITIASPHKNTYIRLGAPNDDHNSIDYTEGNKLSDVGGHRMTNTVGSSETMVGGFATTAVGGFATSTVAGLSTTIVLGGSIRLTAPLSLDATAGLRVSLTAGLTYSGFLGPRTTKVKGTDKTTVVGRRETTIDGSSKSTITGDSEATVKGDSASVVDGLYETYINNRFELIRGFKLERIQGPSRKHATKETATVDEFKLEAQDRCSTSAPLAEHLCDLFAIK
jgi:type VI secretion system secreted protein VgrG